MPPTNNIGLGLLGLVLLVAIALIGRESGGKKFVLPLLGLLVLALVVAANSL